MNSHGVRGVANDWIKSYLTTRKQFVEIDGCASELLNVTSGVSQGSILGPTLVVHFVICNVRLVCGVKRQGHTSTLFQQLGVLKFVDRSTVKFTTAIDMFGLFKMNYHMSFY